MNDTQPHTTQNTRHRRPRRWLVRCGLLHIAAWLIVWGVMVITWRRSGSPGAAWAFFSVLTIVLTGLATCAFSLVKLWRFSSRQRTILLLLFFLLPTSLFVGRFTLTVQKLKSRDDARIGMFERVLGVWAASFVDLQARRDLPRRAEGKHITLVHNHDLDADQLQHLVDEADAYIAALSEQLGVEPSSHKVFWARGRLLGFQGRQLREWAICPDEEDTPEVLMRLDKHEIAHAVIAMHAGPDQYPPLLLVEGWAEVNSRSEQELFALLNERTGPDEENFTLRQLVGPGWYTSPRHKTVYHYGGPFVLYLLERFGGLTFLELYRNVRRGTFIHDAETILNVNWNDLESDFWRWYDSPSSKSTPHQRRQESQIGNTQ